MTHWRGLGEQIAARHPWIVAVDILQGAVGRALELRRLGAPGVFAIGGGLGTGELDSSVPKLHLDVHADGLMEGVRACEQALDTVPDDVQATIDSWDPERRARVFRSFFSVGRPVAGRATFGARPLAWQALEDKTVIDALWAEAGVPHAPIRLMDAERITGVFDRDEGAGMVLSGDNREGFNGGASYVRWVRSEADLEEARTFFGAHCDRVRLMPFLEGLPCSIHGFVASDQLAVFRPCEMLVFRRPGQSTFQYAGVASFWEPEQGVEDEMRGVAQRVGEHLRARFDYRGAFTVDGVLAERGFLPTELNPRIGAGLSALLCKLDIPMELLHYAAVDGLELDWRLEDLEQVVMGNPHRFGRAGVLVTKPAEHRTTGFDRVDGEFVETDDDPMFEVLLGPAPAAPGNLRVIARDLEPGSPYGPVVVELLKHLDELWDLGIGPLETARYP